MTKILKIRVTQHEFTGLFIAGVTISQITLLTMAAVNCSAIFPTVGPKFAACQLHVAAISSLQVDPGLKLTSYQNEVNQFMLIWAAAWVIFMHAGFAMLSAGSVRQKNAKNILICISIDLAMCAFSWFFVGFAFAYGADNGLFIGSTYFAGSGVGDPLVVAPTYAFWFFQYAFAATSATIVSGAIAERANFVAYMGYSAFFTAWIYPVVTHWVWGGGFLTIGKATSLRATGVLDFAGDGPVHMIGGVAGLVGCYLIGPRTGRFDAETGKPVDMPGHSSSLISLGTWILWVGWFGFNPGSILLINGGNGTIMARAAVNTMLSSASGVLSALMFARAADFKQKRFDLVIASNGALAGLVAITGPCAAVQMWAAIVIGSVGGIVYVLASWLMLYILKLDDPLDATAVHFFCGMWGLIAGGLLADPALFRLLAVFPDTTPRGGVFYGVSADLLICQLVEIAVIIAWTVGWITPVFLGLKHFNLFRVPPGVEEEGIDSSAHGGSAYPDMAKKRLAGNDKLDGF